MPTNNIKLDPYARIYLLQGGYTDHIEGPRGPRGGRRTFCGNRIRPGRLTSGYGMLLETLKRINDRGSAYACTTCVRAKWKEILNTRPDNSS